MSDSEGQLYAMGVRVDDAESKVTMSQATVDVSALNCVVSVLKEGGSALWHSVVVEGLGGQERARRFAFVHDGDAAVEVGDDGGPPVQADGPTEDKWV